MCLTWVNGSLLGKMGHIWKNGPQFVKCVTLEKRGHNWLNVLHLVENLEKWVIIEKMGHIWKKMNK